MFFFFGFTLRTLSKKDTAQQKKSYCKAKINK